MASIGTLILVFAVVLVIAGAATVIWALSSSPTLTPEAFGLLVTNGVDAPFVDSLHPSAPGQPAIDYPYVRSGNSVSVTYAFSIPIPSPTPAHPALPVLIQLPTNAKHFSGIITISTKPLPTGQTLHLVQHGANSAALQYQPSGLFVVGSDLTVLWTFIFMVVYTVA